MTIRCRRKLYPLNLICFCLLAVAACPAATTNLVSVADTSIFEPSPDNNLGGLDFVSAGVTFGSKRTRALLRFDVAGSIPPGSSIASAALTLKYLQGNNTSQSFEMHRLRVAWVEGTGTGMISGTGNVGSPANPGEVTWNSRAQGIASWGQLGGQSGVDFLGDASASAQLSATSLDFSSPVMASDVQLWLDNPATNYGWIIFLTGEATAGTAVRLGSRQGTIKPTLSITYSPSALPAPPDIFGLAAIGGQIRFSFNGQAGSPYTIESRTSLDTGWTTSGSIPTLPANTVVHFTNSISGSAKCYRVRTP